MERFYIQDATLMGYGFRRTQIDEDATRRYVCFEMQIDSVSTITVTYTYQFNDNGLWFLTTSRIELIADGIEVPTRACSLDDLNQLYRLLSGKELEEVHHD
ncbi:MAG: hypothetical protein WHS63_07145 [Tenuifilum sp.]|uniref:hypothetical protein n=1 Tax=Tenuifilum sp. TaxID=2760880 RepID=UPI00309F5F9F